MSLAQALLEFHERWCTGKIVDPEWVQASEGEVVVPAATWEQWVALANAEEATAAPETQR